MWKTQQGENAIQTWFYLCEEDPFVEDFIATLLSLESHSFWNAANIK